MKRLVKLSFTNVVTQTSMTYCRVNVICPSCGLKTRLLSRIESLALLGITDSEFERMLSSDRVHQTQFDSGRVLYCLGSLVL
jgi:hypothetical protein